MSPAGDTTTQDVKEEGLDVAADIEQLRTDIKKLSASVVDLGRQGLKNAASEGAHKLGEWRDDIGHMASGLQEQGQHQYRAAEDLVRERPLLSVLAAFGVGMLVARLIDRR